MAFFIYDIVGSVGQHLVLAMPVSGFGDIVEVQRLEYINQCIKSFEEETGATVTVRLIAQDEYSEWLSEQIINGTAPDLMAVQPESFQIFYEAGVFCSIDDPDFNSGISGNILDPWTRGSQLYAIPFETNPPCLIVNRSLIRENDVNLNVGFFDWMDLYYVCSTYTSDTDEDGISDKFGVSGVTWRDLVYANGQTLFNFTKPDAYFDTRDVRFAISYALAMYRINLDNQANSFERGDCVMEATHLADARYLLHSMDDEDAVIISFPHGPDGDFQAEPYDLPIAINSHSQNQETALAFLKHITLDADNQMKLFNISYGFPVLKQVQESENVHSRLGVLSDEHYENLLSVKVVNAGFKGYYSIMDTADKEIYSLVKRDMNLEESLGMINERMRTALSQYLD
jgi:multiple sugar transport system substrate-binding protein